MQISISDIRLDPSTQVRLKTDNEVVTDYAEAMQKGFLLRKALNSYYF